MRFETLGPLRVHADGREIALTAARERILLAALLLHANHTVPHEQLIDAIWTAAKAPPHARSQLQGCVYRLRKRLGDGKTTGQVIVTEPGGYRAVVDADNLDLLAFRARVSQARTAAKAGRTATALDSYRAALGLWRGSAFAGVDSNLIQQTVAALHEERVRVLEERIEVEVAAGAGGELVAELTDLVQQHPYRESLHRALMVALYRAGRQPDALAAYRHVRRLLHDELGTEPGTELKQLHQAILKRDPALSITSQRAEVSRPAATTPPRELPAEVAGFTGRDRALKALDEMLPDGESPAGPVVISAIAGTAGVGKTALTVHWAHRVADRFPHGQLFINLRGYASAAPLRPIEALTALLRSLGIPPDDVPHEQEQAAALYRTRLADRRVLVVLDNARTVEQVRPLLPGSPGCLVLVTSRDRLTGLVALDGAQRLTLDVLTELEAVALLSRLLGPDRIQHQPEAVAALAKACAHLPLALRIAAANLADRPEQDLAGYVDELTSVDRLTALQAEGDQESAVRAALERSYRSIPADQQRMFRLLGLVPGPDFTPAAAAVLADVPLDEASRLLQRLAGAHLVEEHTHRRYTFHDLLRVYARQLAETDGGLTDHLSAIGRLLGHYDHSVAMAISLLYPQALRPPVPPTETATAPAHFDKPAAASKWLDDERPNLVAAITHTADHGPRLFAWRVASDLTHHFWHSRHNSDWRAAAIAAKAAATHDNHPLAHASAELNLASLHLAAARYNEAVVSATAARDWARHADWEGGQDRASGILGIACQLMGRLHDAADYLTESLVRERNSPYRGVPTLLNLGTVHRHMGKLREARDDFSQALTLLRKLGSMSGEANAFLYLGHVDHDLGRLSQSHRSLTSVLERSRELGDRLYEAGALDGIAAVLCDAGRRSKPLSVHRSVSQWLPRSAAASIRRSL